MAFAAAGDVSNLTLSAGTNAGTYKITATMEADASNAINAGLYTTSNNGTSWSRVGSDITIAAGGTTISFDNLSLLGNNYYQIVTSTGATSAPTGSPNATASTFMEVANSRSYAYVTEGEISKDTTDTIQLRMMDKYGVEIGASNLYVWVTKTGSNVPVETVFVTAATEGNGNNGVNGNLAKHVWETGTKTARDTITVQFLNTGSFDVHVSATQPTMTSGAISNASEFTYTSNTVVVSSSVPSNDRYRVAVTLGNSFEGDHINTDNTYNGATSNDVAATLNDPSNPTYTLRGVQDNSTVDALTVKANNVAEEEVALEFYYVGGNTPITNTTFQISSVGAIDTSVSQVTTNGLGQAKFKVSGSTEGTYKVFVTNGSFEFTILVEVGAVYANSIEVTKQPTNAIDILNTSLAAGFDQVRFTVYDVNGNKLNAVDGSANSQGWDGAYTSQTTGANEGYVSIVSQPSASKLENKNLRVVARTNGTLNIASNKNITVEGTYTFKVVLNNGNFATVTIEVKAFTTPVELVLEYPEAGELGATVSMNELYWVDANKVQKDARATLAATGYAIASFNSSTGDLTFKTDEKYVGTTALVTAVDERYNLIASATITVADEASALSFATKTAEVKVNNKIRVNVVDSNGNKVSLGGSSDQGTASISYVVLDKPANARVFATTQSQEKLHSDGYFDMNLTSDTVGNVTVQAIVRYSTTNSANQTEQVKYYTGTQTFAVGTGSTGDVVVMTIGSNDIVVNDETVTTDAAPMVKDNRTFVPFRAGLEAFGAEVSYENNVVTAKLNGVTVAFTIDSTSYTVNDEVKTADVAPFISGDRTYVPVRFIAEAFGITVTPIYDAVTGGTSSVLFNL